jgi:ribosomal protein S18 acetylase RimI-like enzyme
MDIEIRAARPEEYAPLGELTVAVYQTVDGWTPDDAYVAELADVAPRAELAEVVVALVGGRLAGGVTYVSDYTNPYAEELRPGESAIRMLAVEPAFQGRGAGRALVEVCIGRAREAGRHALVLHSTPGMTAAHRLYGRLGFVRALDRDIDTPEVTLIAFTLDLGRGSEPEPRSD